ncbi:MAG: V-type ATPase subunit [Firmicutes bacterium]|nr:V-type ATPase subunit [Bacillota bacterium]
MSVKDLAAAQAITRGLLGRLIGPQGVDALARSEDVSAAFAFLERTPYGGAMAKVPRARRVFREVEHALRQSLIDDAIRIWHFLGRAHRQALTLLMARYEITNIKAVFGAIEGGEDPGAMRGFLFEMGPLGRVDVDRLVESTSVAALVEALKGSPYGETLDHALDRYRAEKTLFPVEVALDLQYFRGLLAGLEVLSDEDRRSMLAAVGPEIDARNLLWVLRYRFNFGLEPEEIFNYIAPSGLELTDEMLWKVARSEDPAEIASALPRDFGALVEESRRGRQLDLIHLDVLLRRRLWRRAWRAIIRGPFSLGMVAGYLIVKRIELDEIITVLESRRYGMPDTEIASFLIHQDQGRKR